MMVAKADFKRDVVQVQKKLEEMKCSNIPEKLEWVKECLEHRDHMTIFRLDSKV